METEPCDIKELQLFRLSERYLVFMDETGDPILHENPEQYNDPSIFPVMTITALIISVSAYRDVLAPMVDALKQDFWNSRDIHLHSREIRRKDSVFKILLNETLYTEFKKRMIQSLEASSAVIISSSINKLKLLEKANNFKKNNSLEYDVGDLYLKNVSWVLERLGHFLKNETAKIIFETRGKKESRGIQALLTEAKKHGTFYKGSDLFKNISDEILFVTKKDNVNGIQMVDYCTYPFARHAKNHTDDNKLFEILRKFVYKGDFGEYGLKEWP